MFNNEDEKLISKLPFGFRDIFPLEAQERKNIKETVRRIFMLWGYGEVQTPVIEFTKNISVSVGRDWKDRLISFFDNDGSLVSMRADMTVPIARLTGMRIKPGQLPVRFFYFANSFRQSGIQKGQKRVLNQAGLELIGSKEFIADVEVLMVLISILEKFEIKGFKISIGHIEFVEGICEWFGFTGEKSRLMKDILISSNLVRMEEFLNEIDKKKAKIFMELIKPSSGIEALKPQIKKINSKRVSSSFKYLERIYNFLQKFGFENYLIMDLGTVKEFDYYSGLVFEIYCPEITGNIGSGGRYDGLIRKFGFDVPATGFALDIDLLHKSIEDIRLKDFRSKNAVVLLDSQENYLKTLKFAEKLRSRGIPAALVEKSKTEMIKSAWSARVDYIYEIDWEKETVTETNFESGSKKIKDLKEY